MNLPMNRPSISLASQVPDGFSRAEAKTLVHLQSRELIHGLVGATHVQMRGFVAQVGIQAVGMLSREADFQAGGNPVVAARTNLIVDQFTLAVAREVGQP